MPGVSRLRADAGTEALVVATLWVLAALLVAAGIVALVQDQPLLGTVLFLLGLLVGPAGTSLMA
jgi:hypothetical protein